VGIVPFACNIARQLCPNFTFDLFRELFENYGKLEAPPIRIEADDVVSMLDLKAKAMESEERLGSAASYRDTGISLRRFISSFTDAERSRFLNIPKPIKRNGKKTAAIIRFEHVTPNLLKAYEQWMLLYGRAAKKKKLSRGEEAAVDTQSYIRFAKVGISSRLVQILKKALSKTDVMKIISYQSEPGSYEERGRDL